jgi:hypothetical protein
MGIETDRDIVTVCHGGGNEKSVVSEPPIVTETGTKVVNRVTTTQTLTGDWYAETHGVTVTEKVVKDKGKKPAPTPVS